MASVNKVILVGNLGRDPETRYAPSGDAICNISIATTDRWKDRASGEMKEQTEWHRVAFFGKLAEIAGQYLKKGSQVYVEGSLRTRKWQDKDGQDRYTTEIRADAMQMLGGREGRGDAPMGGGGGDDFDAPPQRSSGGGGYNRGASNAGGGSANSGGGGRPAPQSNNAPSPASSGFGDFEDDIPF